MNGWQMTGGSRVGPVVAKAVALKIKMRWIAELTKPGLTCFIAVSAMLGQVTAAPFPGKQTLVAGVSVWLLAAGAAVLNNIQDRQYDRWFARTRNRCLPRKKIGGGTAGVLAAGLIVSGLGLLFGYPASVLPGILGLLALICYNGLYTPLKKKGVAGVWPGVVCGMLPPAMGWTAVASPDPSARMQDLLLLMVVLGIWQVPHFLVLWAGQPAKDPGAKRFPCLHRRWTGLELRVQVLIWASLYSLAVLLFLLKGGVGSPHISTLLGGMALALPLIMAVLPQRFPSRRGPGPGFAAMNLSLLVFMVLGILDRLPAGFFPFL
jgi:heme o synthase